MALIQIRDVPEDVYENIRRRARAKGQSMQQYMLQRLIETEGRRTPAEVMEDIRDFKRKNPINIPSEELREIILEAIKGDRQ